MGGHTIRTSKSTSASSRSCQHLDYDSVVRSAGGLVDVGSSGLDDAGLAAWIADRSMVVGTVKTEAGEKFDAFQRCC